jgi:2-oxoglutarate dehydrogenase complex dehydrogenase (E1) component-like enzyme
MKKVQNFLKALSLRQVVAAAFAILVVATNVACSGTQAEISNPSVGAGDMYPYEDTERDTTVTDVKVDRAIREAEARREKVLNPEEDYLDKTQPVKQVKKQAKQAAESAQETADEVGNSAQEAAQNAARNTQNSLENLKDSTQNAADRATDAIDRAT